MGAYPHCQQPQDRVGISRFPMLVPYYSIFLIYIISLAREALYQEQLENFAAPDGHMRPLTYEALRALPLLTAVIRETLRLHPPIHSIIRYVRDDVQIPHTLAAPRSKDGIDVYVVPKGHFVLASPALSQRDPTIWENAQQWDPYRWIDVDANGAAAHALRMDSDDREGGEKIDYGFGPVSKGTGSPYQPFGSGKHRCIGEQVGGSFGGTSPSCLLDLSTDLLHSVLLFSLRTSSWAPSLLH